MAVAPGQSFEFAIARLSGGRVGRLDPRKGRVRVEGKGRPRHSSIEQAFVARGVKRAAIANDDLPSDELEGRAKMRPRLERDDALAAGVDSERLTLLEVEHLPSDRAHQDFGSFDARNRDRYIGTGRAPKD